MATFFRAGARLSRRRQIDSPWPKRRIIGEWLEQRTLLSANLSFAIAGPGPNAEQALAVRTDAAGNVYELATDAVYKFSAAGAQIWSAPYTANSQISQKEGLAVDSQGDVYITGNFSNLAGSPAKFGGITLSVAGVVDGYLAKLDGSGNFLWAESFGGGLGADAGYAVATDATGDAYVTGNFSDSLTIGSGAQAQTFKATGGSEILAAKFDAAGALVWANAYINNSFNHGYGIAVDTLGDAYVTGDFWGTMDFDPAQAGAAQLTTFFPTAFLLKLDTSGNYVWAKKLNANTAVGDGIAKGDAIAVDAAGDVYSTGTFGGPVDLNPNGGDLITTADFVFPDAYVLKLNAAGNFAWAADLRDVSVTNPFGGLQPNDISVDAQGNVYTAGGYNGVANFDPNGTHLQVSNGGQDIYVSALTNQGKFAWVATAGENPFGDEAFGVATTSTASGTYVYASGSFSQTVNFNSGVGPADNVKAASTWDSFLWGLNGLPTRIAGVVWNDQNADGIRQSTEAGLAGIPVALFVGTPGGGTQVASTVSDSLGLYSFNGVASGQNYYIQVSPPVGDTFTTQNAGADLSLDSNVSATTGATAAISISPGQTVVVNAGFQQVVAPPAFGLAFGIATIGFTEGSSILPDATGDFYVAGNFDGSSTFGSGPGAVKLSTTYAPNDFIAKYAPDGGLLWVRQVVSDYWQYAPKLQLDAFGNVYMAGELTGNATIGPVAMQASTNTAYLAKLDSNGNTLWATTSVTNAHPYNVGLAVDPLGNAYVVGGFSGTVTVNTSTTTTLKSAGGYDAFIVKYSPYGAAQWAQNYGGTKDDAADSVAVDPAGNPVITGVFDGTATFGLVNLTSGSSGVNDFIAKLNATDGSVAWARALASSVSSGQILFDVVQPLNRIAIDAQGNVYTTGYFDGKIQLDPTTGTDLIDGTNSDFISKLDPNGNFVWGKAITTNPSGYDVEGEGIAIDAQGNVFTTGTFSATSNFNPNGTPVENLTSAASLYDVFILELDQAGNYVSAQNFGGAGEDEGTSIAVDANGNVYATGLLSNGPTTFVTASVGAKNEQDIFVLRLGNNFGSAVNAAPSFKIQGPLQAVGLNAGPQSVPGFIGSIVPGPPGETNEVASFVVSSDNSALFSVQPAIDDTGRLTYTPAAGAAGTANVTVVLHNNGGTVNGGVDTSSSQTFPITVDVNHAPTFTAGADQTVNENTGSHVVKGWATNISPGPPDQASETLTFLISTDNNSLFSAPPVIDPASGNLTYTLATDEFGTADVTVQLQNSGGTANGGVDTSAPQTFTITVNLVNHAPTFVGGGDQTVNENAGPQSVAGWATSISAGPPSEAGQQLTFIVSTDNNALFLVPPTINPNTGTLTYTPAPDVSGVAQVSVLLQDNGGTANGGLDTSPAQSFSITVNFVNQPPSFVAGPSIDVLENAGAQLVPGWAAAIGPGAAQESGQLLNFVVTTDNAALFAVAPSIDPSTGTLTFTPAKDVIGVANVSVVLHDNGGTANGGNDTSPAQLFTITVSFVNQPPSFTAGGDQTVNEDTGTHTIAGWAQNMSAGPANESAQTLNFIVTTDNSALFPTPPSIDTTTGDLTFTPGADQSGVAHVSVALHDDGGTAFGGVDTSAVQTFTITVNFVNQAPHFMSGGDRTVHESAGPQTIAAWAKNISPGATTEASQALQFIVSTDNSGLFSAPPAIDPATGDLSFMPAPYAIGVAHVTAQLHDDGGTANGGVDTSASQTFTITVTEANQAPSFTAGPSQSLRGSFGAQTIAGWATNISRGPPREAGQALNFIVTTDNDALFSAPPDIDPSTGNLTFTPGPGQSGVADVTVQLHDDGGTANGGINISPPQTFQIAVTFVNQAPTFVAGGNQSVNENAAAQTVGGWASQISAGPPDESGQSLDFLVTYDNSAIFSTPPTVDPVTGTLTYTPAPDANGVAHVTVKLHDSGGTLNGGQDTSTAQQFTITINAVNQPPSFTAGPSFRVKENSGAQTMNGWAQNITPGAANEAGQTLNSVVTTDNDALFAVTPAIDPATGNLTFTPARDANGLAHVTIMLHDNGGTANGGQDTSPASTFSITVTPVNQPPTFTPGGNQTVAEDAGPQAVSGWAQNISPGAPNEAGQNLNFIVTTDNNSLLLFSSVPQIDPATGDLTYTPAPDVSGVAHVSAQLHDNGGIANGGQDTSAAAIFTITVQYVNDAPSFVLAGDPPAVNEGSGAQSVPMFATSISPSGTFPPESNEAGQSVHFNVTGDTNPGLFATPPAIDTSGNLTYMLAPDWSGSAQITVNLQDNGGATSDPHKFNITVNLVNHAPSITAPIGNVSVNEDSGPNTFANWAVANPGGANEATQHITYLVTAANPALFADGPAIDPSGTLTFTPASHVFGSTSVKVVAQDDGGTANGGVDQSPPATFNITLSRINHPPTVANALGPVDVNENAHDFVFGNLANVFDDVDLPLGDHLSLSLAGNNNPELLAANLSGQDPSNAVLSLHFLPDQIGTATIDLQATDQAGATVDDPIVVSVDQVNHAPSFVAGADQRVATNAGTQTVTGWATQISAGPSNEAGQTLSFETSIASTTNASLFSSPPAIDANGNLTFTPAANEFGTATIAVVVHDNGGTAHGGIDTSAPQTFQIVVDDRPVAVNQSFLLSVGDRSTASAIVGVLVGDTDPAGQPLSVHLVAPPAYGQVQLNADGSFTYTKGPGFQGTDSFTYQVGNSVLTSNVATVDITSDEATVVQKLYQQVLHRAPDADGLHYWTQQIENFQPYSVVAQGIFESNERLDPIIAGYYQQFLLRPADAQGLAYWRDQVWKVDGGPEQVIGGMISSPEFFASAAAANPNLSPNAAWVTTLYQRLLNRTPDDAGLNYWTNQLDSGQMSRMGVVNGFEYSIENFQNLTTGFFQEYLGRNPTASELAGYVQQFKQGATQRSIQIELIDTPEYRNSPSPPATGTAARLS